jgi:hypothetical protein
MTSPSVLTFEYVPESQTLELSGDLVASWDEKDRRIASISMYGLGDLKKNFRDDVQGIERAYGSRLHWEDKPRYVYAYLEELSLAGYGFWEKVTGDRDLRWLRRIEESLAPGPSGDWWSALDPHTLAKSVYHMETKGPPEAILPLDALPLGFLNNACILRDETDVFRLASLFGGFRSIVRHSPIAVGTYRYPTARGRPATLYLRGEKAPGNGDMEKVLKGAVAAFIGSFPAPPYYSSPDDIARALLVPGPALGTNPVIPDLVQVHTHAKVGLGVAQKLLITFDFGSKNESVVVRSSHFIKVNNENAKLRNDGIPVDIGPLVVFNSCEALGNIGDELLSSAFDLARFGSRAVVGPREEVLAEYAVKFSRALHKELNNGATIGEAVVAGRWTTLIDYLNPLGLIYATFGDVESRRSLP